MKLQRNTFKKRKQLSENKGPNTSTFATQNYLTNNAVNIFTQNELNNFCEMKVNSNKMKKFRKKNFTLANNLNPLQKNVKNEGKQIKNVVESAPVPPFRNRQVDEVTSIIKLGGILMRDCNFGVIEA